MQRKVTRDLFIVSVVMSLVFLIFRSLTFHLTTHLLDWNDYPYYVWTIFQQVRHFRNLEFSQLGQGNIYYPHHGVMFFSDLLLPQALVATILSFFTSNQILIFNIVFFLSFFLNAVAALFFWKNYTSETKQLLFATVTTVCSPFVFLQIGHLQMINFWPFLFAGGLLVQQKKLSLKRSILIGALLSLQFVTSVYFAVFLIIVIGFWYLTLLLERWTTNKNVIAPLFHLSITGITFLILTFPFLWQYLTIQKFYGIERLYQEYAFYAAHLSDYLFQPYQSVLSLSLFSKWNSFNKHVAGESAGWPGFAIVLLAITGFFSWKKIKQKFQISFPIDHQSIFFICLICFGFIASLGPRLNFNGYFANIPIPYLIVLKLVPIVEPVRATSRWAFLLFFGLTFFSIKGLQRFEKSKNYKYLWIGALTLYCLEIIPIVKTSESRDYYSAVYQPIEQLCQQQSKVLLEYPVNYVGEESDVIKFLTYKSQMLMASLTHHCYLVNGYSGYEPTEIQLYSDQLDDSIQNGNIKKVKMLLEQKNVQAVKLNLSAQTSSASAQTVDIMTQLAEYHLEASDEASIVLIRNHE